MVRGPLFVVLGRLLGSTSDRHGYSVVYVLALDIVTLPILGRWVHLRVSIGVRTGLVHFYLPLGASGCLVYFRASLSISAHLRVLSLGACVGAGLQPLPLGPCAIVVGLAPALLLLPRAQPLLHILVLLLNRSFLSVLAALRALSLISLRLALLGLERLALFSRIKSIHVHASVALGPHRDCYPGRTQLLLIS